MFARHQCLGLKTQIIGVIQVFRRFLETRVFVASLDEVLREETPEDLERFAESADGDFPVFPGIARALDFERLGSGNILWGDKGCGVRAIMEFDFHYHLPHNVMILDRRNAGVISRAICSGNR